MTNLHGLAAVASKKWLPLSSTSKVSLLTNKERQMEKLHSRILSNWFHFGIKLIPVRFWRPRKTFFLFPTNAFLIRGPVALKKTQLEHSKLKVLWFAKTRYLKLFFKRKEKGDQDQLLAKKMRSVFFTGYNCLWPEALSQQRPTRRGHSRAESALENKVDCHGAALQNEDYRKLTVQIWPKIFRYYLIVYHAKAPFPVLPAAGLHFTLLASFPPRLESKDNLVDKANTVILSRLFKNSHGHFQCCFVCSVSVNVPWHKRMCITKLHIWP